MARLARAGDVEQRAAHVVVADLERAHPHVRHVTVGARHAGARMDTAVPHLEFGVLRFKHRRATPRVYPVPVPDAVVVSEDLLDPEPLEPRIDEALLRPPEVVLDVALAAHERPHLLTGGLGVRIVVPNTL